MAAINGDGGPAFPVEPSSRFDATGGMSLRDYFAGQALAELIPRYHQHLHTFSELIAEQAYQYADAMLSERQK